MHWIGHLPFCNTCPNICVTTHKQTCRISTYNQENICTSALGAEYTRLFMQHSPTIKTKSRPRYPHFTPWATITWLHHFLIFFSSKHLIKMFPRVIKNNRNIFRIYLEELSSFEMNIVHLKNEEKSTCLPCIHANILPKIWISGSISPLPTYTSCTAQTVRCHPEKNLCYIVYIEKTDS